jgi:AraC family ethanolamine operon transcriptional activator
MRFSQGNPEAGLRRLAASDPDELAEAQPEKRRCYRPLGSGGFRGELVDARLGPVQLFRERLDTRVRVQAEPAEVVPFAVVLSLRGESRFCGREMEPERLVRAAGGSWEAHVGGSLEYACVAVERGAFDSAMQSLQGRPPDPGWLVSDLAGADPRAVGALRRWMASTLERLEAQPDLADAPAVRRSIASDALERLGRLLDVVPARGERLPGPSRRYAAVRRVEDLLESRPTWTPTIPELCAEVGTSQRTLEYAFREHLGLTPVRYLRLWRLNAVRRELRDAATGATRVTDVALRWGFGELGRFAREYRELFGEPPSATLRRPV